MVLDQNQCRVDDDDEKIGLEAPVPGATAAAAVILDLLTEFEAHYVNCGGGDIRLSQNGGDGGGEHSATRVKVQSDFERPKMVVGYTSQVSNKASRWR